MYKTLLSLPRTVWLIGLISLVNDSASEMIYPLIPIYLSSVLMVGPRYLGVIEGIAEATASLFKLISGVIFDRTRKAKTWIVFGYSLAALGRPLIALANSWWVVLAIRFADRIGKGLRASPRDALLAHSVPESQRGLTFGLHRSLDNAGAVIGPLLAAGLLAWQVPIQSIFYWAIVPGVLTVILAMAIRETDEGNIPKSESFNLTFSGIPVDLRRYLFVVGLFTLGNSSDMFLLLRAQDLGVPAAQIPLLWAGISLVTTLFGTPLSGMSDRFDRRYFIAVAWIAFVIFYFGMSLSNNSITVLLALFGLYGLFKAATEGVEKALVADMAPQRLMGTAFGWFNLISGLMLFPASFIFGWLYETISPAYAFIFSGSCAFIAVILMVFWVNGHHSKESSGQIL